MSTSSSNNRSPGRAWVQVKTGTNQAELDDYIDRFKSDGSCERFFFVCRDAGSKLRLPDDRRLHLWADKVLADKAISVGLFDWLIERTR